MRLPLALLLVLALAGCGESRNHRRHLHRGDLAVATAARSVFPLAHPRLTDAPTDPSRPNIVFVLTDDLSTDLVRYMPAVRRLRREGMSFRRYIVSDSLCCPSRASIFTGRLPHDTGVFTNIPPDGGEYSYLLHHDDRKSFALTLRYRGYRTALMGKYLNGYRSRFGVVPPGWTDWAGTGVAYLEFNYTLNLNGTPTFYGQEPQDYLTDVIAARGSRFIDTSAEHGRPFFLELATFAPHRPAVPAPRDLNLYPNAQAPRTPAFNEQLLNAPEWLAHRPPLPAPTIAHIDRDYRRRARSVAAVNDMIETIEQELRETGQERNTYFVFSSDNGYHMGQHRLTPGKFTAFDTDVRVPLVVVGPGIRAGSHTGALAQNTDLAPTFERLAGATPPPGIDGRSLVPLLRGHTPRDWRRAALIEHHHPAHSRRDPDEQSFESGDPPTYEAMRTKSTTYVEYLTGEREFYFDRRDPDQMRNAYPDLTLRHRARLHRRLERLVNCHGAAQCATAHVRPR